MFHRFSLASSFSPLTVSPPFPPDILDSALLRPGRIDRKIEFPPPGPEARVSILRIHSRKVRLSPWSLLRFNSSPLRPLRQMSLQRGINFRALAEKMGNCSGAEVRGICTEAGMYALRERRIHVGGEDFEMAIASACSSCSASACATSELTRLSLLSAEVLKKNAEANTSSAKLFN